MKRLIAATLVAAIGVSLLTGCGVSNKSHDNTQVGTTENSSDKAKNKEVKMHVWCSKNDVDITTQMIESFKEANKGTDFNIIIEESEDSDARDNILSNVHNGADVFPIADDQITSMVAGGALYEIEDVDAVKKADDESAVEAATIDGKLYGYPLTADNGYFMYYNKNYFSDSDVATLDGMLDIAGANGKYLTMDWSSGWYLYSFFGNTGLDFGVNDDGVTNHCNWNAIITDIKGVDIAQAIADKLGMKLKVDNINFDSIIPAVTSGKDQIGIAGMTVTEDRATQVDFSDSYYTGVQVIIVTDDSDITEPDDLKGKKIGVQQGTTGDIYSTDDFGDDNVERFNKGMEAVQALQQGKIDAVIIDNQPAKTFVEENEGLKILETSYVEEDYALAIKKGNDDLVKKVNDAIKELKEDGTFDKIVAKYITD